MTYLRYGVRPYLICRYCDNHTVKVTPMIARSIIGADGGYQCPNCGWRPIKFTGIGCADLLREIAEMDMKETV